LNSVADFLKRTADRNGFSREKFEESKIPNDFSNIIVFPFFGDINSLIVLSSFLLHRYRNENKASKYFILASWPGYQGLFPYVDEYWSLNDFAHIKNFYENSSGFINKSDLNTIYLRNFNEFFRDIVDVKEINQLYNNGFTNKFFEKYKDIKRFLPFISSSAILGKQFNKELATYPGYKIFIHPSFVGQQWALGTVKNIPITKEFWITLVNSLLEANYTPVVWTNYLSYDISQDFVEKCIFFKENDISRVITAIRASGFALDVFNGLSKLASVARCPYLHVDERSRYFSQKDYEIDDLFPSLPKDHIFTFSTIISNGNPYIWRQDVLKSICLRLNKMLTELDKDTLPSTLESMDLVSYDKNVRKTKSKKLGVRLLHVPKD
jgi:hypothetical protein